MKRRTRKAIIKAVDISAVVLAVIAFVAGMISVSAYDYKSLTPLFVLAASTAYLVFFAWANGVFDR
jgi:hypothetical protein